MGNSFRGYTKITCAPMGFISAKMDSLLPSSRFLMASQVLRIFIDEIQKQLKTLSGTKISDDAKLGAISFIQRFGSKLNLHIHYHCVVMDGTFCEDAQGLLQFLEVDDLSVDDTDAVQNRVRKRVLSLYKRKGLLTEEDAANLKSWKGSGGFSVNADPPLNLTAMELLDKLAHLIPPPRRHRHPLEGWLSSENKTPSEKINFFQRPPHIHSC